MTGRSDPYISGLTSEPVDPFTLSQYLKYSVARTVTAEEVGKCIKLFISRTPGPLSGEHMLHALFGHAGVDPIIWAPGPIGKLDQLAVLYTCTTKALSRAYAVLKEYRDTHLKVPDEIKGMNVSLPPYYETSGFHMYDFYNFSTFAIRAYRRYLYPDISDMNLVEEQIAPLRKTCCIALRFVCLMDDFEAVRRNEPHVMQQLRILRGFIHYTGPGFPPEVECVAHLNPAQLWRSSFM
jgi:hypothetical protein